MPINVRKLAPALVVLSLALAGCQTPSQRAAGTTPATSTAPAGTTAPTTSPAEASTSSPVEFYLAQPQSAPGMMEVKLPDGALYMQRQAVLTRDDLSESAALVDKQGVNFVGLRFTEAGARKLTDISTQNIGKMLALVVDRQLVAAPRISEPLNRGVLAFSVGSAQEATELAARIRGDAAGVPPAGTTPGSMGTPPAAPRR